MILMKLLKVRLTIVEEVSEEIDETKEVPKEDNLEEDSKS